MPAQASSRGDGLAWASIATGAASWLVCCCAPVPFVGMIMGILGLLSAVASVVCGALAYRSATRDGGRTDLPLIGLALGGGRLVLTFGVIGVAVVLLALGFGAGMLEMLHSIPR
jgi:peptidoglycan biosynthesis protein MviN/MurJ (putative lipid II flippase)